MKAATLFDVARSGRLRVFRTLGSTATRFYRACFLAGAARCGLLGILAQGPSPLEAVATRLGIAEPHRQGLAVWLRVGVSLGELSHGPAGYALAGHFARALAQPGNDDLLALLEEMVDLHHRLLVDTPQRLARERPFTLAEHDGTVVARSSRVLETFVREAVDSVLGTEGSPRLLEIGCGSGTHLRHAAARCPGVTGLGLELQPDVAEQARRNLADWGLADRFEIVAADVREREPSGDFDLATLHQNIYYFPVEARPALLAHVRGFLRPGGRLLLTTACSGGSTATAVLSLWGAVTEGCGPLPEPAELEAQIRAAGFDAVESRNLVAPVDRFFAFAAVAESSPQGAPT